MHELTVERAVLIFERSQAWFGPSAIILRPISEILAQPTLVLADCVIDGRIRIAALRRLGLTSIKVDALQVPEDNRLACTELIYRGHYQRAFQYLPECWSHSLRDIQAYTSVPMIEALQCFASRKKVHQKPPQERKRDYERLVQKLRSLFEAFDEGEIDLGLEDIRKVINDPPTTREDSERADTRDTE